MTVQAVTGHWSEKMDLRRGACPTLGRPMTTGDGLLARMRLDDCRLTVTQMRAVAQAAAAHGNGIIEVTARGSLQIRGLKPETVAPLEQAIFDAGITPTSGLMVEIPPLAGLDPEELIDPRPVAHEIRQMVAVARPVLVLAPKLAVIVDGGGRFHLGSMTADVRLMALADGRFLLAVGGTNRSARKIGIVEKHKAAEAVLQVLVAIAAIGPTARARDIDILSLHGFYDSGASDIAVPVESAGFLGVRPMGSSTSDSHTLGIALPYRQARAGDMIGFLDEIEILGLSDIRLSPGHGLILAGLHHHEALEAEAAARRHGFWALADEPRSNISLCAGSLGCASAHFDTRAVAEELASRGPALLDGSIAVHLSGCPKGCAHPAPAALAIVGSSSGYGLVVNGAASDTPALYIAAKDLGIGLDRLASLVAGAKETGETARDCLARLSPADIAAALTLDGQ